MDKNSYEEQILFSNFIKSAYELVYYAEEHPSRKYDVAPITRYLSHGYYLQLANCENKTETKPCNLILRHQDIKYKNCRTRGNTYSEKDINLAILKLMYRYATLIN